MNNTFKILNEGEIRFLKYKEYQMIPNYVFEWYRQMEMCRGIFEAICKEDRDFRSTRESNMYWAKYKDNEFAKFFYVDKHPMHKLTQGEIRRIAGFMEVIPFKPAVMFNISPNWKGEFGNNDLTDVLMIKNFKKVIESNLNENHGGCGSYTFQARGDV